MAVQLSTKALLLSQEINAQQQIILTIDGFDEIFGARPIGTLLEYGDEGIKYGDPGLVYGGIKEDPRSRDWIMLEGTTNQITSQLSNDSGEVSSVSRMVIKLIDQDNELSNIFSPGVRVPDVLARQADVYLTFEGGAFPRDAIRIFSGVVTDLDFPSGSASVTIAHPEELKRQDLFIKYSSALSSTIDASVTTIPVETTTGIIASQDALITHIRIDDEIMEVVSQTTSTFTVTRGALGTTASTHDNEAEVNSHYQLKDNPIDLALKVMLSNGGTPFKKGVDLAGFNQVSPLSFVNRGIGFDTDDVSRDFGLVAGDTIEITGATNPVNNGTFTITSIAKTSDNVGYVTVSSNLTTETETNAIADLNSQFNTLPVGAGLGMTPLNVDVQQHFDVQQISGVSFPEYDLDVIDTVKGKELINNQIYFPIAFRSVPRGGKASVITELPPLAVLGTKKADQSNIKRPSRLNVKRSINQNFYNTIVYRFGKSRLEDRFLAGEVRVSGDSLNRIAIQNKVLTIDAPGLRDGPATRTFLQSSADKLLRKFQYGAESFSAEPNYKTGFNIDVGDTIIWDSENLQMINADKANRDSFTRIYEVQNKSLNVKTGAVKLELVNTIFGTDTRFGVVGPASKIASGATTTKIPLKRSFVPDLTIGFERDKWENYLNARVRVHNDDFTFDETVTFVAFDPTLTDTLIVSPALSVPPSEDFLVDMPKYDAADTIWKTVNAYTGPRDTVTSGASSTVFDVDNPGLFFVDGLVRVHTEDYSVDSPKVTITDVTGSTITVDKDLGFTPAAGYEIDLIGFASDEGAPYTFF